MKLTLLISIFLFLFSSLHGQTNAFKYRVFAFPIPLPFYASGLGYEKGINEKMSFQLLLEANGFSYATFDGPTAHEIVIVSELKRRFGEHKEENLKTSYISAFLELGNANTKVNYADFSEDKVLTNINNKTLNLGLAIGKHVRIGKRTYLDLYLGGKHKFVIEKDIFMTNTGIVKETSYPNRWGARIGFMIGYLLTPK